MAEVTELVTVFKFKGNVKPLEDAGDAMQEVSENSAIASKRMDGAGDSFEGMGKSALAGLAGVVSLGAALTKITQTVFALGQETAELKGLGIDPIAFRETEDLFNKLGAADGDAENFVKKITEAQSQLSLGQDSAFARSLQEQFGVLVNEGDKVEDVLSRLREATEKQGFTAGQISIKAGELGFSPEFSKVLLATNDQFADATKAIKDLAQSDKYLLEQSQATTQSMKELNHQTDRFAEMFSARLAPVLDVVINVLGMVVDGWTKIFKLADEFLEPIFLEMWKALDENVIPAFDKIVAVLVDDFIETILAVPAAFEKITDFLGGVFYESFVAVGKAFDFFVSIFEKNVMPVIKLLVDTFFNIIDAIREAISKIPFVGGDSEFKPIERPSFGSNVLNRNNSSSVNNQSSTTVNISGLSTEQINNLIKAANDKKINAASGSW